MAVAEAVGTEDDEGHVVEDDDAPTSVATGIRICNSTTPNGYRTGDGEVRQASRPGADQHFEHPSLQMGVRVYRWERS